MPHISATRDPANFKVRTIPARLMNFSIIPQNFWHNKNANYFAKSPQEVDETFAETTSVLAKSLPLDDELRALVPRN
ncbi:hypothetical protein N9A78_03380 [Akkermansiaceae bacterium]|jgi:hypothetical protein|nr:hypothetical protein [Akkermansiaceae bacterium]